MGTDDKIRIDLHSLPLAAAVTDAAGNVLQTNALFLRLCSFATQRLPEGMIDALSASESSSGWSTVVIDDSALRVRSGRASDSTWLVLVEETSAETHPMLLRQTFHDIRSPLAVIAGQAGLMDMDTTLTEAHKRAVADILWGTNQVESVVQRMSDLLRCAADPSLIQDDRFSVGQLLESVQQALTRNDVNEEITLDPPQQRNTILRGDFLRTAHTITQLVMHAASGGVSPTVVRLRVVSDGEEVIQSLEVRASAGKAKKRAEWYYARAMARVLGGNLSGAGADPMLRLTLPVRGLSTGDLPVWCTTAVDNLPSALRRELMSAAEKCDLDLALQTIDAIEKMDHRLAGYLAKLAAEFDYDTLTRVLNST